MRAAICVRVSPRPQDKVRYSPEIQEATCREWCAKNGHEVAVVVRDILVSGGSASRFDSIFAALDETQIDLCVVSDLSRWTRDDPERFWFIKKVLTDRGVRLYSVEEPWLGSDMPFSATITTAVVEKNSEERKTIGRKTSAGIKAAIASGRDWGAARFGWTWNPETRRYDKDTEKVVSLFEAWVSGEPAKRIGERFGMATGHVGRAVYAPSQRRVVGDDLWLRAQQRPFGRGQRNDAKTGNVFRGLLRCPFCDRVLHRTSWRQPYRFYCVKAPITAIEHPWRSIDIRTHVVPLVVTALGRLVVPEEEIYSLTRRANTPPERENRNYGAEIERLTMAWVKGRIPDEKYEKAVATLEAERDKPRSIPAPVPQQVELARFAEQADLWADDIEEAELLNRVLREAFIFTLDVNMGVTVKINPPYDAWAR